jgi:hypothetical protein|tara:strand:+ start:186 stop:374 length:189 start_codon:yes stop_codon:yes gene_type:complete
MTINTAKEIKDFLRKDNDAWYGQVLEGILDTYQDDMTLEQIDDIIKEEVKDFQQGYERFKHE